MTGCAISGLIAGESGDGVFGVELGSGETGVTIGAGTLGVASGAEVLQASGVNVTGITSMALPSGPTGLPASSTYPENVSVLKYRYFSVLGYNLFFSFLHCFDYL